VCFESLYVVTADGGLWSTPLNEPQSWQCIGAVPGAVALTGLSGRLFVATASGAVLSKLCDHGSEWVDYGYSLGATAIAGHAGWLYACGADGRLRRRAPKGKGA
jgi:hypothetical protein